MRGAVNAASHLMSVPSPTIDSFELARSGRRIEGEVAIARLPRLAEFVTAPQGDLRYEIEGLIDDEGHPAADLHLDGRLLLICQRCNAALDFELNRTTRFRFVATEEELNSLPIEDDEIDAVVGSRNMSVHEWVEDEAILSLPLVPRHETCSAPLRAHDDPSAVTAPNPFAVLLALRDDDDGTKRRN
jgi:uncharacterized protein